MYETFTPVDHLYKIFSCKKSFLPSDNMLPELWLTHHIVELKYSIINKLLNFSSMFIRFKKRKSMMCSLLTAIYKVVAKFHHLAKDTFLAMSQILD